LVFLGKWHNVLLFAFDKVKSSWALGFVSKKLIVRFVFSVDKVVAFYLLWKTHRLKFIVILN